MKDFFEDVIFRGRVRFLVAPDSPTDTLDNVATPNVSNGKVFKASGATITVTNFLGGADGQGIYIKGDGTTTIANNTSIKTNIGSNKLLSVNRMYHFIYFNSDKLWVEL